jgi:hypothetical protein
VRWIILIRLAEDNKKAEIQSKPLGKDFARIVKLGSLRDGGSLVSGFHLPRALVPPHGGLAFSARQT